MVYVTLNYQDSVVTGFKLSGHANADEPGKDLVCAAVSAVTFGMVNAIEDLIGFEPEVKMADLGYIRFVTPDVDNEETAKLIQVLIRAMIVSLETIERDHSQYIQIKKSKTNRKTNKQPNI